MDARHLVLQEVDVVVRLQLAQRQAILSLINPLGGLLAIKLARLRCVGGLFVVHGFESSNLN